MNTINAQRQARNIENLKRSLVTGHSTLPKVVKALTAKYEAFQISANQTAVRYGKDRSIKSE